VQTAPTIENARPPLAEGHVMTVRYFAWVREKIGRAEECIEVPASVATVADLVAWLKTRGAEYEAAFGTAGVVRAALDQTHVKPAHLLAGAKEVAFFPPVTGG
jgi:molybdopterin synthase sulfur carrier subunit